MKFLTFAVLSGGAGGDEGAPRTEARQADPNFNTCISQPCDQEQGALRLWTSAEPSVKCLGGHLANKNIFLAHSPSVW